MVDNIGDIFRGWFKATPLEIYECLHEFSSKFIDDEDYNIDPVVDGGVISVTGLVLESITGYDSAYTRPAQFRIYRVRYDAFNLLLAVARFTIATMR